MLYHPLQLGYLFLLRLDNCEQFFPQALRLFLLGLELFLEGGHLFF